MSRRRRTGLSIVATFLLSFSAAFAAKNIDVKIVGRQSNGRDYTYAVPMRSVSNSSTNVNCSGNVNNVNCNGADRTTTSTTPAQQVSYHVNGVTLSLQLPDGRVAVVNCASKFAEHFAGSQGNHRSCRAPLVNDIQAQFDGDRAKLKWPVSIDGKKFDSETYKILGILDRRQ